MKLPDNPGVRFSFSPITFLPSSTSNSVTTFESTFSTSNVVFPEEVSMRLGHPLSVISIFTSLVAAPAAVANTPTRPSTSTAVTAVATAHEGATLAPLGSSTRRRLTGRSTTHAMGTA